jgi:hypothetical protein
MDESSASKRTSPGDAAANSPARASDPSRSASATARQPLRSKPLDAAEADEAGRGPAGGARGQETPNLPDWRWRSFPVFAAFVAGVLVDSLINPASSDPALALRLLAIFGVCYAVVHVVVTNVIVARRIRRYEREGEGAHATAPDESTDDEWEDEVVYPGEE